MSDIFASKAVFGTWRVNPAQDRRPSEVISYTMPPEELAKYNNIKPYKRPFTLSGIADGAERREENKKMGRVGKITVEQLICEMQINGTSHAAQRKIAEMYDMTPKAVNDMYYRHNIKKVLLDPYNTQASTRPIDENIVCGGDSIPKLLQEACTEQADGKVIDVNAGESINELTKRINKEIEIFEKNKKEAEIKAANKQINDEDTVSEFGAVSINDGIDELDTLCRIKPHDDWNITFNNVKRRFRKAKIEHLPVSEDKDSLYYTPPKQPILKPTQWQGAKGRQYYFYDNSVLIVMGVCGSIEDLDTFIVELQELRGMREVEE